MSSGNVVQLFSNMEISWEVAMEQFIIWKRAEGRSPRTLLDYKKHISRFFQKYPQKLQSPNLRSTLLEYLSEDVKPATFNLRLSNLKAFFDWCVEEGFLARNPIKKMKRRHAEARVVDHPREVLIRLLELPDTTSFAGLRDYTMIVQTLDTGIRPKEALSLTVDDVNLSGLEVYVRADFSKTRTSRTLPLSHLTARVIRRLLRARHPDWTSDTPVICSCDGTFLSTNTWGDRMEHYSRRLGISIRPYDLRHCFAIQYLRNGGHTLALQKLMGHRDLAMTKRYVNFTTNDLKNQHIIASPIALLLPSISRKRKSQ